LRRHPCTATVTFGLIRAPFCPSIAVNIVSGRRVHSLALAGAGSLNRLQARRQALGEIQLQRAQVRLARRLPRGTRRGRDLDVQAVDPALFDSVDFVDTHDKL